MFTENVQVVRDRPSYDHETGYRIHEKQTLADFFSRAFPQGVKTRFSNSDSIAVGTHSASQVLIHFMRALRVPEDGNEYDLPPGLGRFPLYDIRPYKSRLPKEMSTIEGCFLPMYRKQNVSVLGAFLRATRKRGHVDIL